MSMTKRILIADDDSAIAEALRALLEDEGYNVTHTTKSSSVRNIRNLPDLLILDIWMAGQDGLSLCKHLKGQKAIKTLPIIIMSANKDSEHHALEAGADDFLAKPFTTKQLLDKIKKHLA